MAATTPDRRSPVVANLVVILGFVAVFSTFATDSAFSWIIGAVLIVAGGIWAGVDTTPVEQGDGGTA